MAKKKEETKIVLERIYTIPLRKEVSRSPKYKRAKKAINVIKRFIAKHMKAEEVKVGKYLNLAIWAHGIKNVPHHIKVNVKKDDKGEASVELFGAPVEKKKEKKIVKSGKSEEEVKKALSGQEEAEKKIEEKREATVKEEAEEAKEIQKEEINELKKEQKEHLTPPKAARQKEAKFHDPHDLDMSQRAPRKSQHMSNEHREKSK